MLIPEISKVVENRKFKLSWAKRQEYIDLNGHLGAEV